MSLSLNPIELWKLFADGKHTDKEQIATWLDQTAAEARQIADIWLKAQTETSDRPCNSSSYSRLQRSLETSSLVFDGRINEKWQNWFSNNAAQVLVRRDQVKRLYERLYGSGKSAVVPDGDSRDEQLREFETAVGLLNRDAAALEILARNFRASK